ncbi:MAG: RICIN domain-containing protein [Lachnospiraceae bacterium]|nr:RICIN domain-containing protein [Lachnospiraceae bacterium]
MKKRIVSLFLSTVLLLVPVTDIFASSSINSVEEQESVENIVEESSAEIVEKNDESAEMSLAESEDESIVDSQVESSEESLEEIADESAADSNEESLSVSESADESIEESFDESVPESAAESVDESVEESIAESVLESTDESIEEPQDESVLESTDESIGESQDESVLESTDESIGESQDESAAESEDESSLETTEELFIEEKPSIVGTNGEDAAVSAGVYQILSSDNSNIGFYVNGNSYSDNAGIITNHKTKDFFGLFKVILLGNKKYEIINFKTGKALTVSGNSQLVQAEYKGNERQQWYIVDSGNGTVSFVPVYNNKLRADITNASAAAGKNIILSSANDSSTQKWKLVSVDAEVPISNGTYTIATSKDLNVVMEVEGKKENNGANICLGNLTKSKSQIFVVTNLGYNNYYKIENVFSGKVLDVAGNRKSVGTNIQQYTWNGTTAQIFQLVKSSYVGKTVYEMIGKASNLAVDYAGGSAKSGVNVRLYTQNHSGGQKWYFSEASVPVPGGVDAKITSGYYKIYSAKGSSLLLGIQNGDLAAGKQLTLCANDGVDGTVFKIEPTSNERYKITSAFSGLLITYEGSSASNKTKIVQRNSSGSSYEEWYIRKPNASSKEYVFCSCDDPSIVMDLSGGKYSKGNIVRFYNSNGTVAQKWTIASSTDPNQDLLANGIYSIGNAKNNSMVMAVGNSSISGKGNIILSSKNNTMPNQLFYLERYGTSGNIYKIINVWSGLSLDVEGGSKTNKANLQQYAWNGTTAQLFRIIRVNSGSKAVYKIIGLGSGNAVDISGGRISNGTNIWMYGYNASAAQLWTFTKTNKISSVVTGSVVNFTSRLNTGYKLGWKVDTTGITLQKSANSVAQAFLIEQVSSDAYRLYNYGSGKYLTANGSQLTLTSWSNDNAHKWKLIPTESGDYSFYLCSVSNGKYVTTASSVSDGSTVSLSAASTSNNKRFVLKPGVISTGWVQINGNWRYYNSDGSYKVDTFLENGKYYINSQGFASTGWAKYGAYYYYYRGRNGRETYDARPYLSALFGTRQSKTNGQNCPNCPYKLTVDVGYPCTVTVYTRYPGTNDFNIPVFAFYCSPGTSDTPTDMGTRKTGSWYRYRELMGPSYGQYATELLAYTYIAGSTYIGWTNNGEYFHSIACGEQNDHNLDPNVYNLLGTRQSHGCVRLTVRYAYWIYEFCDRDTQVIVSENMARPMTAIHLPRAINNIDPTDPAYTGNYGYLDTTNYSNWNGSYLN